MGLSVTVRNRKGTKILGSVSRATGIFVGIRGNVGASFGGVKSRPTFFLDQMEDEVTKIQFVGRSDLEAALSLNHPQKRQLPLARSHSRP